VRCLPPGDGTAGVGIPGRSAQTNTSEEEEKFTASVYSVGPKPAMRFVKGAVLAFIGAKRRPVTGRAGGSCAVSYQEGQGSEAGVEGMVFAVCGLTAHDKRCYQQR